MNWLAFAVFSKYYGNIMNKQTMLSLLIVTLLMQGVPLFAQDQGIELKEYFLGKEKVEVQISSLLKPTDMEGLIKEETGFYFLRYKYKKNFFNINLPQRVFDGLDNQETEGLIAAVTDLYTRSFDVSKELLGTVLDGYKFNITFANVKKGHAFNRVYHHSKTSNIFTNFLPYKNNKEAMAPEDEQVILHEIGHSVFAISIGILNNPEDKYMGEGFADYFANKVMKKTIAKPPKIVISKEQADRISGLAQMDVDAQIWDKEFLSKAPRQKGYLGVTHHLFGLEFITAFTDLFGEKNLKEFLKRFRASEDTPKKDYGTSIIKQILSAYLPLSHTLRVSHEMYVFTR